MRIRTRFGPAFARLAAAAAGLACLAGSVPGQERFRRFPPLPDALRELRLPEIESASLPNGLTIAVARQPGTPLVTLQFVILAGEGDSPPNLPYLATLTARMIGRGSAEISADEMENMVESIGGDFSVRISLDSTVLTLQVLAEHVDRALEILRQMILPAAFSDQEVATVKRVFSYELRDLEKSAEFLAQRQLFRVLFEGHPYEPSTSSWDVVKYVTSKDMAAFYSRFYRPNNAVLTVSGGVDAPVLVRKAGQLFAPWQRRDVNRTVPSTPFAPNNKERVCFVEDPTAEDFVVFVGNLAMPPTSPDYYPFLVLNQVLGGTMGSRLFMNLRESKGYAYDAFSDAAFFRLCGIYWARARVTPETIPAAIQEIIRELKALASTRVVPDEIEQAKSFLIGNLPLKFDSPDGFAERLAQVVSLGLGASHWSRASDSLMLVNADHVLGAAQRCFTPVPVVVIVGNRQWAVRALNDFDAVEIYDNTGAFKMTLRKGVEK